MPSELTRLHLVAPALADAMLHAAIPLRTAAAYDAAKWAIDAVGLCHPEVSRALTDRSLGKLPEVAVDLDEYYLELMGLHEEGEFPRDEVLVAFGRARAAFALEFAIRDEPFEAVYEAGMAVNDWTTLDERIRQLLQR